jgi:hypothetical protein
LLKAEVRLSFAPMKNPTLLFLLAASLLSASASAEVKGHWAGKIHLTSSQGHDEMWDCGVGLIPSGKYLYVDDTTGCTYTPEYVTRFTVKNGQLFYEEELYGTVDENGVHLTLKDDVTEWHLMLAKSADGTLDVKETYSDSSEPYSDETTGNLAVETRPGNIKATHDRTQKKARLAESRR